MQSVILRFDGLGRMVLMPDKGRSALEKLIAIAGPFQWPSGDGRHE